MKKKLLESLSKEELRELVGRFTDIYPSKYGKMTRDNLISKLQHLTYKQIKDGVS